MAVHNWVRCHWRNGRHDLHDLPQAWRETIESHFGRQRARTEDLGVVRVATVDALELAWVECEVTLGAGECGFTYRRARAIHALVRPTAQGGAWTPREVESLLGQRYGEPVERGLPAQHPALARLRFPEDAARGLGLFVGRAERLPSELPQPPEEPTVDATPAAPSAPVIDRASGPPPLRALVSSSTAGEGLDRSSPEQWFRRFKLLRPLELAVDRPAHAVRGVLPDEADADGFGLRAAATPPTEDACPEREAADEGAAPVASSSNSAAPAAVDAPALALAPDPAPSPVAREDEDEQTEQPAALFDLSTTRVPRPPAPPSSLSGLGGPSPTAVW